MARFSLGLIAVEAPIVPGAITFSTPGVFSFVVPNYSLLSIDTLGASGGGSGSSLPDGTYGSPWYGGTYGTAGTLSRAELAGVLDLLANGGAPGNPALGGVYPNIPNGSTGAHGTASGGDTNTTGGGPAGGIYGYNVFGGFTSYGGSGGYGGRARKNILRSSGLLIPGQIITVTVGARGTPGVNGGTGPGYSVTHVPPGYGIAGSVAISWS